MTFHPFDRNFLKFRMSRARLVLSLLRQNDESLCSHDGNRQPCQKSPSTNTTTFFSMKTMSGRPGRVRTWHLNLTPRARNSPCTNFSSDPSLSFTRFIARERSSGVRWSGIKRCPLRQCCLGVFESAHFLFSCPSIRDRYVGNFQVTLCKEVPACPCVGVIRYLHFVVAGVDPPTLEVVLQSKTRLQLFQFPAFA